MSVAGIETLIRRAANHLGIDVRRYRPERTDIGRLSASLADKKIDVVFDIGANIGQFAMALRAAGYAKRLVSFEPLTSAHAQLLLASRHDKEWIVAPRVAIGDSEGEIEMHVAGNSVSSSALEMLESHIAAASDSVYVASERAPLVRLDRIASEYATSSSKIFLKIDTQGYEDRVLDGAKDLLDRVVGLQMEMSLLPLYKDQKLFDELADRMRSMGFSIWAIWPGLCSPDSGRMLQLDVVFVRD